jgi:hypothetical protein
LGKLSAEQTICGERYRIHIARSFRGYQMSNPDKKRFESELDHQQAQIETIEVHLSLKDASVASECEVNNLQAAQQVHRDKIHEMKKNHEQSEDRDS